MGITKDCISAPLEAGTSLLESQKLPPQLHRAFEYISDRLVRKNLHLTMIAARHDLPSAPSTPSTPSIRSATPTSLRSPSSLSFSKFQLPSLPGSPRSFTSFASSSSSHASSPFSPCFPPSTPGTPFSASSPWLNLQGITLHHASNLTLKASQRLQESIAKASKKFSLPNGAITAPSLPDVSSSTLPSTTTTLSADLIRRSLQHNEVLFSTEGLTLLSLDRVYTFKLALSAYTRTLTPIISTPAPSSPLFKVPISREEKLHQRHLAKTAAVDELRLLVLSQKGRHISQSYLLRAYDHLSTSLPALRSVNEAYKTAFHADGIELDVVRPPVLENLQSRTLSGRVPNQLSPQPSQASLSSSISSLSLSSSPPTPVFEPPQHPMTQQSKAQRLPFPFPNPLASNPPSTKLPPLPPPPPPPRHFDDAVESYTSTPTSATPPAIATILPNFPRYSTTQGWVDHSTGPGSSSSLSPASSLSPGFDRGPYFRAPPTPAGYEEVTPITRGEWNCLMDSSMRQDRDSISNIRPGSGGIVRAPGGVLGAGWFNRRGLEIC